MDVNSGVTRVGVVTYGTTIYDSFNLNPYSSTADVQAAIADLPYRRGAKYSDCGLGIPGFREFWPVLNPGIGGVSILGFWNYKHVSSCR